MQPTRVSNMTDDELLLLQQLHQEGRTISYISLALGKSISTIWRNIRRLEKKVKDKERRRHLYGPQEPKPPMKRPPTEYSNRSPYGIASPGIIKQ